jgi:hypothetical protein
MEYSQEQLNARNHIIQSHKQLCMFLDAHIVNVLTHLFDAKHDTYVDKRAKIAKYIENVWRSKKVRIV